MSYEDLNNNYIKASIPFTGTPDPNDVVGILCLYTSHSYLFSKKHVEG